MIDIKASELAYSLGAVNLGAGVGSLYIWFSEGDPLSYGLGWLTICAAIIVYDKLYLEATAFPEVDTE